MSAARTGWRFRSAGIEPSRLPFAAKTNEFAPMFTERSESRSQDDPYATTAAVLPIPAAAAAATIAAIAITAPRLRRRLRIAR